MFEQWLIQEKIKTASIVEMNSIDAIKQCVAKGLGITIMPDIAAAGEIDEGSLSILSWEDEAIETAVLMIWHREKWISPLLKCFMDKARTVFLKNPSSLIGDVGKKRFSPDIKSMGVRNFANKAN